MTLPTTGPKLLVLAGLVPSFKCSHFKMYLPPSVRQLIPLIWLVWVAVLGSLLRWHAVWPIEGLAYTWWLHGHSHLAFLGWLFNAFYVHFTRELEGKAETEAGKLFFWLQIPLLGMAWSFPLTGYSPLSIIFSTAHIFLAAAFAWRWFRKWQQQLYGIWLQSARLALLVMLLSNVGPFVVAYAQVTKQAELYAQALHYYLYFQYAGWFSLAIWSVLQRRFQLTAAWLPILLGNAVLYYLLSFWQASWWPFFIQLAFWGWAVVNVVRAERAHSRQGWRQLAARNRKLWLLAVTGFVLKCLLEALSLIPQLMQWAETIRPLRIGYLHSYFLGMHSGFLLVLLPKPARFAAWWVGGSLLTWLILLGWTFWVGFATDVLAPALLIAALMLLAAALLALYTQWRQFKSAEAESKHR